MRILYFILFCLILPVSIFAQSNTTGTKKSSDQGKSGDSDNLKVKASYRSNKFHHSKKKHKNVDDVVTDRTLKNALKVKKERSAADKYKKSQAEHLNNLNSNTRYKDGKKNTGIFYLY